MWKNVKQDMRERFLNFEAFNGLVVFIPWGIGFVYYGLYQPEFSYTYGMVSMGVILIVWGLRKVFVNRIKQQVAIAALIAERADSISL